MESKLFIKPPSDPYRRIIWSAGLGFLNNCIIVPLIATFVSFEEGIGFFEWLEGYAFWGISLIILLAYIFFGRRISRPAAYYVFERLPVVPMGLVYLDGGLRLFASALGNQAMLFLLAGMILSAAMLPRRIDFQRIHFQEALDGGYLKQSLDSDSLSWDTRYDNRRWEDDAKVKRPGFLLRLLFWIGPAVGMSLGDVIGRLTANALIGLVLALVGYFMIGLAAEYSLSHALELRSIENELGHELHLVRE